VWALGGGRGCECGVRGGANAQRGLWALGEFGLWARCALLLLLAAFGLWALGALRAAAAATTGQSKPRSAQAYYGSSGFGAPCYIAIAHIAHRLYI
jgi:hypothetical protein